MAHGTTAPRHQVRQNNRSMRRKIIVAAASLLVGGSGSLCSALVPATWSCPRHHFPNQGRSSYVVPSSFISQRSRRQSTSSAALKASRNRKNPENDEDSLRARNEIRTCVRNFLTQRSLQSFIFLLTECRDPHTVNWLEEFGGVRNLIEFHGTGAFNTTRFNRWDSFLMQMMERPGDVIIVSARRRGDGHGGWSKNNPYLQDRYVEFRIDIDPISIASRIISVREQLAREWVEDLDIVAAANDMILKSYFEKAMDARDKDDEYSPDEDGAFEMPDHPDMDSASDAGVADLTAPYSAFRQKKVAFDRNAMYMLNNHHALDNIASSPLRKGNFDLIILLSTQESIHRVLRVLREAGKEREITFRWLRDFYIERVGEFFDGNQRYGRADDFLEELLLTPPSIKTVDNGKMGALIDPLYIAEEIIRMRTVVAQEWKEAVADVPQEHMDLRKALLARQMQKTVYNEPIKVKETKIIEGGDFE